MTENKYPINSEWKDYYKVLEGIRRSGICNMWVQPTRLISLPDVEARELKRFF